MVKGVGYVVVRKREDGQEFFDYATLGRNLAQCRGREKAQFARRKSRQWLLAHPRRRYARVQIREDGTLAERE